MRAAVRNTSRGAHAAPTSARLTMSTARPRHGRLLPGPLPALLIALVGGGLGLAALPQSGVPARSSSTFLAQSAVAPTVLPFDEGHDRHRWQASRSRSAAEPEPLPAAGEAAAVPAPAGQPILPGCDGEAHDLRRYSNGRLPDHVLCELPGDSDEKLRADAAVAFARLAAAYQRDFKRPLCVTDGYRTYGEQRWLRANKPRLAARPGTSEHGWGLALDLACGVQSFRTSQHAWVARNAGRFGWELPQWAARGGSKPEPWHWEYVAGS